MKLSWAAEFARNLIYPPRCPFCDRVLGMEQECRDCAPLLVQLENRPFRLSENDHDLGELDGAASVYLYEGIVRDAILRMKYHGRAGYGETLGRILASRLFGCTFKVQGGIIIQCTSPPVALEYDVVVPVPPSDRSRGYNAPELMAAELARLLGLPMDAQVLTKTRRTARQEGLKRQQRLLNLIGAFRADPRRLRHNARVLLVDDVITTGATVSACADALLKADALDVFAVSAAVRRPGPEQEE